MTTAYWCVLVAALMPYVASTMAKAGGERYNNRNPRRWLDQQQGFRARANAAQANSFEAFPFFAAAVIVAHLVHAPQDRVDALAVIFVAARRSVRRGLLEHVTPVETLPAGAEFGRILVPLKLGDIGEEMVATAIALAKERGAAIDAITMVRMPRRYELDGELPPDVAARVDASLEEARALGVDYGVEVHGEVVRARSIGHAIVQEAERRGSDLGVLGSSARWRRQSRFFSPTVDFVLRNAPCEVLVVAFPDGVFEE